MINLELKYLNDLCIQLLVLDKIFAEKFENFPNKNYFDEDLDLDYKNKHLDKYIEERVQKLSSHCSLIEEKDIFLIDDSQLQELLQYVYTIRFLADKQEKASKQSYCDLSVFNGYNFCDGRLTNFELNNQEHYCKIIIHEVLCYDDKRPHRYEDVETANIIVQFKNVIGVEIKGTIRLDEVNINKILYWDKYNISDTHYCFSLFCITGFEKCKIDIIFSEVITSNI